MIMDVAAPNRIKKYLKMSKITATLLAFKEPGCCIPDVHHTPPYVTIRHLFVIIFPILLLLLFNSCKTEGEWTSHPEYGIVAPRTLPLKQILQAENKPRVRLYIFGGKTKHCSENNRQIMKSSKKLTLMEIENRIIYLHLRWGITNF